MMFTQHFSANEIGAPPEMEPHAVLLAAGLEEVRAAVGPDCAVIVISGYRSPARNAAVGGEETSFHPLALAADVRFRRPGARWGPITIGEAMAILVTVPERMPLVRRIIEDRRPGREHVHVEVRHPDGDAGHPLQYEVETEAGYAPWTPA